MAVADYFYDKLNSGLGFEPTTCQSSLFSALASFITETPENDLMLINGYAGTGKTSALSALVKVLQEFSRLFVLMAPTGRAAKVLSGYTGCKAFTIHKQIYRQRSIKDGVGVFTLDLNKSRDTVFIVDEASLISST
ncbi:MAG: AAA family ATPase, partial [Bacteroidales bacterium]